MWSRNSTSTPVRRANSAQNAASEPSVRKLMIENSGRASAPPARSRAEVGAAAAGVAGLAAADFEGMGGESLFFRGVV